MPSIQNRKTVEKDQPSYKMAKKFHENRKPHTKPSKPVPLPVKFHIPIIPYDMIYKMVTSGCDLVEALISSSICLIYIGFLRGFSKGAGIGQIDRL